jgi:plastocyanin
MLVLALSVLWAAGPIEVAAEKDQKRIAMKDDCDPSDPAWAPTGGCSLKDGETTFAEFGQFLTSPFYNNAGGSPAGFFLVGHPAWRNEPSHVEVEVGENIHIKNEGGRAHTFTPVAEFGGGRAPINVGTIPAPECALAPGATDPYLAAPGDQLKLKAATEGIQRFQCCFHPWMRATVRVEAHHHH